MIATDPRLFAEDPNVVGAMGEALARLTSVPLRYVKTRLQRIPTVSRLGQRLTCELAHEQWLASRGAVRAEYLVVVPGDANVSASSMPHLFHSSVLAVDEEKLTQTTREAIALRTGSWTYIVDVARILWTENAASNHNLHGTTILMAAVALAW
eukprot:CAMPEP_0172709984 /NCGR_PEP_ID=MMETSP1074-20121228/55389_1 /TAXON_ID=2916 /ORGANISM="Ceratium fusus, Strain PA161109" /LENGTH=152 /DNA_ID=CAMNT_0013533311 /DNA_START=198 /DNA_END=656 /DNA_ORIENTATION=-